MHEHSRCVYRQLRALLPIPITRAVSGLWLCGRSGCFHGVSRAAGEDPYLTGQYAIQFTRGMQESPDDPYHIQVGSRLYIDLRDV
jgi:hypothetical protein